MRFVSVFLLCMVTSTLVEGAGEGSAIGLIGKAELIACVGQSACPVIQARPHEPTDGSPLWNTQVDSVLSLQEREPDDLADLALCGSHPSFHVILTDPELLSSGSLSAYGTPPHHFLPILRC